MYKNILLINYIYIIKFVIVLFLYITLIPSCKENSTNDSKMVTCYRRSYIYGIDYNYLHKSHFNKYYSNDSIVFSYNSILNKFDFPLLLIQFKNTDSISLITGPLFLYYGYDTCSLLESKSYVINDSTYVVKKYYRKLPTAGSDYLIFTNDSLGLLIVSYIQTPNYNYFFRDIQTYNIIYNVLKDTSDFFFKDTSHYYYKKYIARY